MKTTMTDRPFGRVLAEMRHAGHTRQARELRRRSDASLARAEQLMAGLLRVEQAQQLIEQLVADLAREISPDIGLAHRFYDGRWQVSARLDELWIETDGCPRSALSQIAFLLDPVAATGHLVVECHVTVRGRDLPVERHDAAPADDARSLAGFVEQGLLGFAALWLERMRSGAVRAPLAA